MTAPAHLTDEQIARFRNRTLPAAELLQLDEHMAECAACRERLYARAGASRKIRAVRAELSGHLGYEQIVECSEGSGAPEELAHLRDCAMCQAEVQDLSRFRTGLVETPRARRKAPVVSMANWKKWRTPAGIAAAVVLVAGAGVWNTTRRPKVQEVATARPAAPQETPLNPADREALDRAVAGARLERAAVLDHLIAKPGTLLGPGSGSKGLELLSPVGTTVLTDRPLLRWTPAPGATRYSVSIFDERIKKVAESPALTGTDWRPSEPLPRDKVLMWQVTATTAKGTVRAPRPPTPEARFEVVPEDVVAHIDTARQQHPGNALLLAALCARAGALDDADQALRAMDPAAAERYRESIAAIRHPK